MTDTLEAEYGSSYFQFEFSYYSKNLHIRNWLLRFNLIQPIVPEQSPIISSVVF